MAPSSARHQRIRRDWANLDAGPAGLVAEHVLRNDLVDLSHFRAVCRAWRACSAHLRPQGVLDRRFLPRRWILLPKSYNNVHDRRRFLNVFTGESIYRALPDLDHRRRCYAIGTTSEGLVLQLGAHIGQLLNPLTGQVTGLPSTTTLMGSGESLRNLDLRGAGLADDGTVVLHFDSFRLAVAKPGDERWTRIKSRHRITSVLPFAGRVYCATSCNISLVETQTAAAVNRPPQLAVVADHELHKGFSCFSDFKYRLSSGRSWVFLVENNGQLILCHRAVSGPRAHGRYGVSVYRVNQDAKNTVPLCGGLDGKALFLSKRRSLLVSAGVSPSINADTAYLCSSILKDDDAVYAFDLLGGGHVGPKFSSRLSCSPCVPMFKKDDVANYLSSYVSNYYVEFVLYPGRGSPTRTSRVMSGGMLLCD